MPFSLKSFLQRVLVGPSSEAQSVPAPEPPAAPGAQTAEDPFVQRMLEVLAEERMYLDKNNLPHELEDIEEPIVVITTRSDSTSGDLSKLGAALEEWLAFTETPTRILGLDHLKSGRHPEVSTRLLGLPVYPGSEGYTEKQTALIATRDKHNSDFILDDLEGIVSSFHTASVVSYSTYWHMMH